MTSSKIFTYYFFMVLLATQSCQSEAKRGSSIQLISETKKQDSIFSSLQIATNHSIPQNIVQDSLAVLILPLEASCPACRKKTIDSIVKHQENLARNHFIILSVNGGRKTINSYFKEENASLPQMENNLILDSVNLTYKLNLCADKPTIYYAYDRKVYQKVEAIPATVREDLREFFSGYRK